MKVSELQLHNLVINENASLGEAMLAITDNQRGAICVLDEKGIFKGIVSDGEIRRALVAGAMQTTPLSKILNPNPRILYDGESLEESAERLFLEYPEITLIPVLASKSRKLVDVKVRDLSRRKDF